MHNPKRPHPLYNHTWARKKQMMPICDLETDPEESSVPTMLRMASASRRLRTLPAAPSSWPPGSTQTTGASRSWKSDARCCAVQPSRRRPP